MGEARRRREAGEGRQALAAYVARPAETQGTRGRAVGGSVDDAGRVTRLPEPPPPALFTSSPTYAITAAMTSTLRRMMVRLSEPQIEALKAEAGRLGIPVNEVLRRLIDDWRGADARPPRK